MSPPGRPKGEYRTAQPEGSPVRAVNAPTLRPRWQLLLPFVLVLAALLWLFRDTAAAMVGIWSRSDTFAHAFLVPPIVVWLVWRQRAELVSVPRRPSPWVIVPMAAVALLWLLGELASVSAASQFALVALIVLSVPALYGLAVTRTLLFPLGFLFFSVPVGEFLVPTLINHTADFTIAALRQSGVPVYREGNSFVIPSGSWSVVEACSGVRYLIASLMVGTLFAYLNYRSMARRWAFVGVAIVVPIVANWLRAYMIVMLGHLSGNTLAVGVDHIIYGWVFFGLVVGLMFWIGSRWAQPDSLSAAATAVGAPQLMLWRSVRWTTAAGVVALAVGAQILMWRLEHGAERPPPALSLASDDSMAGGPSLPFDPGFRNPSATTHGAHLQDGRPVWVWVGYYRQQGEERKLVSSINAVLDVADNRWTTVQRRRLAEGPIAVNAELLRASTRLDAANTERLRVWQWYWIDGEWEASDVRAKLRQATQRVLGRGDDGAVLIVATPMDERADERLSAFVAPRLARWRESLESARSGGRPE
ncbi:MAG: exosortase A [Rubrivivax sp.]